MYVASHYALYTSTPHMKFLYDQPFFPSKFHARMCTQTVVYSDIIKFNLPNPVAGAPLANVIEVVVAVEENVLQ